MESVDDILGAAGATDTPPAGAAPRERERAKDTPKWKKLRESLTDLYTAAQVAAFALGDMETAALIGSNADSCVDAWITLAQQDRRVENFLTKITTGSAWGGVVMAHAGIVIPMLAKRGILPGGALFGGFGNMGGDADSSPVSPPIPDDGIVTVNGNGDGAGN